MEEKIKSKFKSEHKHRYYVWCAACNHENVYRERLKKCPMCLVPLHEKRYLM